MKRDRMFLFDLDNEDLTEAERKEKFDTLIEGVQNIPPPPEGDTNCPTCGRLWTSDDIAFNEDRTDFIMVCGPCYEKERAVEQAQEDYYASRPKR